MRKLVYLIGLVAVGVMTQLVVPKVSLAEEAGGEWKWVDVNGDCVSQCDKSEFECPCYRFTP